MRKEIITLCILFSISNTAYAGIPSQVYEDLEVLEQCGYIEHQDVSNYNRKQLADYVAGILEKDVKYDPILASRILEDEAHLVLIKEQEHNAKKKLDKIQKEYKESSELLFRKSIQGENRLEVMTPLKERYEKAKQEYISQCGEYEQAKGRTKRLETIIEKEKEKQFNPKINVALANLRTEFIHELNEKNYFDDEAAVRQMYANSPVRNPISQKFKMDGQIQFSHSNHDGVDVPENQTKIKMNLYNDYNFDRNWHFLSNLQAEKVLSPSRDFDFEFKNYYIEGKITPGIGIDVGKFNSDLAEGNVYDGTLKGAAIFGEKYRIEKGAYEGSDITGITLNHKNISAGRFDFTNPDKTIYMLGGHLPIDKHLDLGAMYLKGENDNGYVLSLDYNKKIWTPKTSKVWLRYYYQPSDTYFKHTMNGLADNLLGKDGFKGYGIGYNYLLNDNWTFGLEYYRLNNLMNNDPANTIFLYFTYSFKNYVNE